MATPPPCFSMSSVMTDALPFGLILAMTFSGLIPTCVATANAVPLASPVSICTSTPMSCNARIAYTEDGRGASESAMARTWTGFPDGPEIATKIVVRPCVSDSDANARRTDGSCASADWRLNCEFPT